MIKISDCYPGGQRFEPLRVLATINKFLSYSPKLNPGLSFESNSTDVSRFVYELVYLLMDIAMLKLHELIDTVSREKNSKTDFFDTFDQNLAIITRSNF